MKNLLIFTILILFSSVLPAQNIAFHENFEPPSFADSVTSSQTVPGVDDWALSSVLASKGQYSDSCTTITGATSYLTTEPFTTTGKYIVHLDFDQICKLDFLDIAMIEISTDNGALWLPLTGNEYLGSSLNFATLGRFISSSYGNDWLPGDATAIPDNTWWKHEKFDISTLAGDKTSVMIRFKLQDGGVPGPGGNYGWLIDEIIVRASVSELDPPLITMIPPVYTGHIYNLGPFPVKAVITDASGIDEAYVVYNVNSGINDTITMTPLPADTFLASIPAANHLDTICYHVVAIDASLSQNLAREPMNSCNEFVASAGVIIPYYNSLDWLGSLSDFIITNTTYGRVHHNVAAANTGAGGMVMDASAQTNWTTTLPDTTNPFLSTYIWNPNTNPTHFAQARLTLFSQGYTALYLKFDLKQLYYGNNLYTHFRVVVNGTQITPHFTPKGSTTQYNTYEFDLTQFLPATSLVIDFESKVRYPFTGTTTNGNFIDNILVDVPPQQEAYLIDIIEPVGGCGLGNEPVTIRIKNKGTDPIVGNMTASYMLLGSSNTVTEPVNDLIVPGDTLIFTFNTPVNLSTIGIDSTFEIMSYINLAGDPYTNNDTAYGSVFSAHTPPDPIVFNANIPYGTYTTLTAISNDSLYWFDVPAGGIEIATGPSFTTPVLYGTTVYYVEARSGIGDLKLTEILQFKSGSGYTNPYPPYCPSGDWDGIEITNMGSAPVDMTGYTVNIVGAITVTWSPPAGTILNAGEVLILSFYGTTAVPSPQNNFFVTPTSTSVSSASLCGYFIKDPAGVVIDACASNGYQFQPASGVTSADWSGNLPSSSGNAGIVRIASDNNTASDWSISSVTPQTIGSVNPSLAGIISGGNGCPSNRVPDTVYVGGAPPLDGSITGIYSPNSDYNLTAFESVTVKIKNYGTLPFSNFPVGYIINGGTPVIDRTGVV